MTFLSLTFRAFCHETEVPGRVSQAVEFLAGTAPESVSRAKGYYGNRITIMELRLDDRKQVKQVWSRLKQEGNLAPRLSREVEDRLDDELAFHVRFSKQQAYLGKVALAEDKDVVAMSGRVESYPANRKGALRVLREDLGPDEKEEGG